MRDAGVSDPSLLRRKLHGDGHCRSAAPKSVVSANPLRQTDSAAWRKQATVHQQRSAIDR